MGLVRSRRAGPAAWRARPRRSARLLDHGIPYPQRRHRAESHVLPPVERHGAATAARQGSRDTRALQRRGPTFSSSGMPYPATQFIRQHNEVLSAVLTQTRSNVVWEQEAAHKVPVNFVSANWFGELGYGASLGRFFMSASMKRPTRRRSSSSATSSGGRASGQTRRSSARRAAERSRGDGCRCGASHLPRPRFSESADLAADSSDRLLRTRHHIQDGLGQQRGVLRASGPAFRRRQRRTVCGRRSPHSRRHNRRRSRRTSGWSPRRRRNVSFRRATVSRCWPSRRSSAV